MSVSRRGASEASNYCRLDVILLLLELTCPFIHSQSLALKFNFSPTFSLFSVLQDHWSTALFSLFFSMSTVSILFRRIVCSANAYSVSSLTNCFASHLKRSTEQKRLLFWTGHRRACKQAICRVSTLTLQSVTYLLSIDNRRPRFRIGLVSSLRAIMTKEKNSGAALSMPKASFLMQIAENLSSYFSLTKWPFWRCKWRSNCTREDSDCSRSQSPSHWPTLKLTKSKKCLCKWTDCPSFKKTLVQQIKIFKLQINFW